LQNDTAEQVLKAKMADIAGALGLDNGAMPDDGLPRVIVTSNSGCHMQLIHGARAAGLDVSVRHVMDLLDEAYSAGDAGHEA